MIRENSLYTIAKSLLLLTGDQNDVQTVLVVVKYVNLIIRTVLHLSVVNSFIYLHLVKDSSESESDSAESSEFLVNNFVCSTFDCVLMSTVSISFRVMVVF